MNKRVPTGTTGRGVQFIRVSLLSPLRQAAECLPQTCTGTDYIDLAELKVLGGDPNELPSGPLSVSNPNPTLAEIVTFDATAVTDPDSAITGYDWDFDGNGSVDRTTATPTTHFEYGATGSFNPVVQSRTSAAARARPRPR